MLEILKYPFARIHRAIDQYRKNKKRREIEEKYKHVFVMMNMDFNCYKALIQIKNDELEKYGLL